MQISIWGSVGEVCPDAPRVSDVLRIRGFNAASATAPFDKWHPVELVTTLTELKFDVIPDDSVIGWEKALNPNRTVQDRTKQVPPQQTPFQPSTSQQQQHSTVPLHPAAITAALQSSVGPMTQAPKFCQECGGILVGPYRRAYCDSGKPHQ